MNRLATMLRMILKPMPFPQDTTGFETALQDWELLTTRWENMAVDMLNDAVRRQFLLEQTPQSIRMQLTLQGPDSYEAVLNYMVNARDWSTNPDAMEVDALTKGKGKDGKDKWTKKGKDGKGKDVKGNDGKGKGGKGKSPCSTSVRKCYTCDQEGHLARECPEGPSLGKGGKKRSARGGEQRLA